MNTKKNIEVLVVGAGPTGLVMAAELARRGVRCRIIDTERGITDKSKAIGIQSRTMELFENMGIVDEFIAAGHLIHGARLYDDGKNFIHLDFDKLCNSYPYLLLLPQTETERFLVANLEQYGIRVERQTKLLSFVQNENSVEAEIQTANGNIMSINADWLVGCDGAHSTVRHILNIPFEGEEYEEGFQLADVSIDWSLDRDKVHIMIHKGYLTAAFPLPGNDNRYRLILDMEPDKADTNKTPRIEELQQTVNERIHVPALLSDPKWTANYRIHRRIVTQLRKGRVFIGGDAAHIHSPAAAQGMNTGIQDVFNLAWKLALVVSGHSPESILESYHLERYPVEMSVLKTTDLLLKMVSLKNPIATAIRDFAAPLLTGLNPVKKIILEKISELSVSYPNSPIVEDHHTGTHYRAGERMPDGKVLSPDKNIASIFDLLRHGTHLMLLFSGTDVGNFDDNDLVLPAQTAKRFGGEQLLTCLINTGDKNVYADNYDSVISDPSGALHKNYDIKNLCVYLLRPDGYIAFCSDSNHVVERLNDYLPKIFK